jgi:hypothetical protein
MELISWQLTETEQQVAILTDAWLRKPIDRDALLPIVKQTVQERRPLGQWNTYEIQVKGNDITVTLNGQQVSSLKNGTRLKQGFIGLQIDAFVAHRSRRSMVSITRWKRSKPQEYSCPQLQKKKARSL